MKKRMRILIAYDGFDCAEAALEDLQRAGLPEKSEAVVMSVADVFVPEPINEDIDTAFPLYIPSGVRRAHKHASKALKYARGMAERASRRVAEMFPSWEVRPEAEADSPAWAVIKKAWEWEPDLVIVGAHGHRVLGGRLILGSVSQRVLYEARCSVRIARSPNNEPGAPAHIIVGTDGSPDAEAAVEAVAARKWPEGSVARIVSVVDTVMPVAPDAAQPSPIKWVETSDEDEWDSLRKVFEPSAEKLRKAGLDASIVLRKGNPKNALVEEAEEWGADSIFLGARGMRGMDRLLLGSVSAAIAARANCSVEIIR